MMKTRLIASLLATGIALLSGCANQQIIWDKAGGNQDEFNKDNYKCMQESQQQGAAYIGATRSTPAMGTSQAGMNKSLYVACMQAQGYTSRQQQ